MHFYKFAMKRRNEEGDHLNLSVANLHLVDSCFTDGLYIFKDELFSNYMPC